MKVKCTPIILFLALIILTACAQVEKVKEEQELLPEEQIPTTSEPEVNIEITPSSPRRGTYDAKVKIFYYNDFGCEVCIEQEKEFWNNLKQEKYFENAEVSFFYKHFIPENNENGMNAALSLECANKQKKFSPMHDFLAERLKRDSITMRTYAVEAGLATIEFNECFDGKKGQREINEDIQEAKDMGATTAPFIVITNDQKRTIITAKSEWAQRDATIKEML